MVCALPFFDVQLAGADWLTAAVVIAVGSVSLVGLGILAGILPLLYPERGEQMSFMVQALVLLVSGVYYSVAVLPGLVAGRLGLLARHVPVERDPGRPPQRDDAQQRGRAHWHPRSLRGRAGAAVPVRLRPGRTVG